ncbi:neprilysin-11 [Biomphalaria pfeifferi]|uniref:Neprilysin-11 n=1 Tax=Biomphalaria pfeifferi TaxID=112525 RepID=A0AAD8C8F8_BIOPF|nr:neprilysin-11 [Biomphalaria pfeifferi]
MLYVFHGRSTLQTTQISHQQSSRLFLRTLQSTEVHKQKWIGDFSISLKSSFKNMSGTLRKSLTSEDWTTVDLRELQELRERTEKIQAASRVSRVKYLISLVVLIVLVSSGLVSFIFYQQVISSKGEPSKVESHPKQVPMHVAHTDTATLTSKKDLQHQPLLEGSSTSRKAPSFEAFVDSSNSVAKTDTSLFVTSKRTTPTTMKAERFEALTYMQNSLDLNVNPCEDFYQFACGKWNTSYHLPNGSLEVNMFSLIENKTFNEIKALLEAPAKDEEQPSFRNTRKYFTSCMNEGLIDQMGYDTLKEILLQEFGGWPLTYSMWDESKFDLEATVKNLNSYNISALFYFTADSDLMNNSYRTLQIGRGDFETIDLIDVTQKDLLFKYYGTLITEVAKLLGPYTYNVSVLMDDVKAMVQLEMELASLKEGSEGYTTLKSLVDTSQVFDWMKYVTIVMSASEVAVNDVNENEKILLKDVFYLPGMVGVISKTTNRTLANYLVWKFILTCIKVMTLPRRFFDLYEEYLSPIIKIGTTDRSRLCTSTTSNIYMYAVAQMFVSEHFDSESKQKARDLIKEIQKATDWALEMNGWMDRKTKIFAKEKLKLMDLEIGYPEELENDEYLNHLYINVAPPLYPVNQPHPLYLVNQSHPLYPVNQPLHFTWSTSPIHFTRSTSPIHFTWSTNPSTLPGQPAPSTLPVQPAPSTLPGQPTPSTLPGQPAPSTLPGQSTPPLYLVNQPLHFTRSTSPIHFTRSTSPIHFTRSTSPIHFTRSTSPIHFTWSTNPSTLPGHPAPSTLPVQPAPSTLPGQPAPPLYPVNQPHPLYPVNQPLHFTWSTSPSTLSGQPAPKLYPVNQPHPLYPVNQPLHFAGQPAPSTLPGQPAPSTLPGQPAPPLYPVNQPHPLYPVNQPLHFTRSTSP